MGELARTRLGEVHAVAGPQAANLAFEIRALCREISGFVDEAIPHVDIDDPGLFGAAAIKIVEIDHVGGRARSTDCRQAYPEYWRAFALEHRNRVIDSFGVDVGPFLRAELVRDPAAGGRRLRRDDRRLFLARAFRIDRRRCGGRLLSLRRLAGCCRRGAYLTFTDRLTVGEPDHHHDDIRLLGGENVARGLDRIIGLAAGLDLDQPAIGAVLARDAEFRRFGECLLEPIAEPVGHGIAQHHDVGRRRRVMLARRRRLGEIDRRLAALLPRLAPRPRRRRRPAWTRIEEWEAEIELRGGRRRRRGEERKRDDEFDRDQQGGADDPPQVDVNALHPAPPFVRPAPQVDH